MGNICFSCDETWLNTNYDSLHFHANNNFLLRSVMGIASYDVRKRKEYGFDNNQRKCKSLR